jgi:holo-ACP synthase CitX
MNDELKQLRILEARERRVECIEALLKHGQVIVSLRVNYPGVEKDNRWTKKIADQMNLSIIEQLKILQVISLNEGEGPVHLYLLNQIDGLKVKEAMVQIEEHHPLGRLVDLDVYDQDIKSLSRRDLNKPPRKCFLCDEDAFICIRNQKHDVRSILTYIKEVVEAYEG